MPNINHPATQLLTRHTKGDPTATDRLRPMVYQELRSLAARFMRYERKNHTLEPTALVHEAYLRLVDNTKVDWQEKSHFYGLAAQAMRRVLVDHARHRRAQKRGGGVSPVALTGLDPGNESKTLDILALDEALDKLGSLNPRHCEVVKLRFFAGLSCDETAQALSVTARTVKNDWSMARAWLLRELDT